MQAFCIKVAQSQRKPKAYYYIARGSAEKNKESLPSSEVSIIKTLLLSPKSIYMKALWEL